VVPAATTSRSTKAAKWRDETGPSSHLGDVASAYAAMRWAALPQQRIGGSIAVIAEFDCQPQAIALRTQGLQGGIATSRLYSLAASAHDVEPLALGH
jgi:hypothetical protein